MKKQLLLIITSFLSTPTLVSCFQPYQEIQKGIAKTLVPTPNTYNPKTANPIAGSPILEENSDTITNSVLGFNGLKKNPKIPKNQFDVTKNYTEEIPEASFIDQDGGTGKYGLLPYWYFLQSIPTYLEKNGGSNWRYDKEKYLKQLEYFHSKIRGYYNRNLVDYQGYNKPGQVEVWKGWLRKGFDDTMKEDAKGNKHIKKIKDWTSNEELTDKDKIDNPRKIDVDTFWPLIKPELEKDKSTIDETRQLRKKMVVFDFLLAHERMWPSVADKDWEVDLKKDSFFDRFFRDQYYIDNNYKPSDTERSWYELGWFMLRVQRIHQAISTERQILETIGSIEKSLFNLNNKNQDITTQLKSKSLGTSIESFVLSLSELLRPDHHLNLRKDLVFNIDASNNQDDQSLIADLIDYYNRKIAPIIWRLNYKSTDKTTTLTEEINNKHPSLFPEYINKYLKDYLPEIKEIPTEAKIGVENSAETKEAAEKGIELAGKKAWGQWLKENKAKYQIEFSSDNDIDIENYSASGVSSGQNS